MPIIRSKTVRAGGYVMIANELSKDKLLTLDDKGLMLYLLTFPDNWIFYDDKIREDLATWQNGELKPLPKQTLEKCFKRLRHAGYVRRVRTSSPTQSPAFTLYVYEDKTAAPPDNWAEQPTTNVVSSTTYHENGRLSGRQPTTKMVDISKTKKESNKTKYNNNSGEKLFSNSKNGLQPSGYSQQGSHNPAKNGRGHNIPDDAEERIAAGEGPAQPDIFTLYQNNIGLVTQITKDNILDWLKCIPELWITEAIRIANDNSVRKWSYIESILTDWQAAGRMTTKAERDAAKKNGYTNGNGHHKPAGELSDYDQLPTHPLYLNERGEKMTKPELETWMRWNSKEKRPQTIAEMQAGGLTHEILFSGGNHE
jgi:DnaD/phage-associated family protein